VRVKDIVDNSINYDVNATITKEYHDSKCKNAL
jgi:hypothetical protein